MTSMFLIMKNGHFEIDLFDLLNIDPNIFYPVQIHLIWFETQTYGSSYTRV